MNEFLFTSILIDNAYDFFINDKTFSCISGVGVISDFQGPIGEINRLIEFRLFRYKMKYLLLCERRTPDSLSGASIL